MTFTYLRNPNTFGKGLTRTCAYNQFSLQRLMHILYSIGWTFAPNWCWLASSFFRHEFEARLVRPIAAALGDIPNSSIDFLSMQGAEIEAHRPSCDRVSWLHRAYTTTEDGRRMVCGSNSVPFPNSGPSCKYAALFDDSCCVDGLRIAFLTRCGPGFEVLSEQLAIMLSKCPDGTMGLQYAEALVYVFKLHDSSVGAMDPPEGFIEKSWPALARTMRDSDYYFSVQELVVMAALARVNVVVAKSVQQGRFQIEACNVGCKGPCAVVCLTNTFGARVRSHFERLWKAEEIK